MPGLVVVGGAFAQAPERGAERAPEVRDGERLAEGLRRSLDALPGVQEELATAQQRLRDGAAPMDVLRELSPAARRMLLALSDPREGPREGPRDGRGPDALPPGQGAMERDLRRIEEGRAGEGRAGEGRAGEGREGPGRDNPRLSRAEALEEAERLLREELPEIAAGLPEMRANAPMLTEGLLLRLAPRLRDARATRARDAQLAQLKLDEVRTSVLVLRRMKDLRDAAMLPEAQRGAERERVLGQLREALAAGFDTRVRMQRREVELIAERLDRARRAVEERASQREEFLERAIQRARDGQPPMPEGPR